MMQLFLKIYSIEPANTTDLPETQVSITFPFCFNQHSDHRMLQSFLKMKIKNWFLFKAWVKTDLTIKLLQ